MANYTENSFILKMYQALFLRTAQETFLIIINVKNICAAIFVENVIFLGFLNK